MKKLLLRLAAPKPRNPLVAPALHRKAGVHTGNKRSQSERRKDLLQRLREAGL